MNPLHAKSLSFILILLFSLVLSAQADCPDCKEVAKGMIPEQFLAKHVKQLPSGIHIWDVEEAIPQLRKGETNILWVDTRPKSFFKMGTVKNAVLLVYDQEGVKVPEENHGPALTLEKLTQAMKALDPDPSKVTVVYFCQGPECHRSYNAALQSAQVYGLSPDKVVWFRDGYPHLEKAVMEDPKLKRRKEIFLQGDILK